MNKVKVVAGLKALGTMILIGLGMWGFVWLVEHYPMVIVSIVVVVCVYGMWTSLYAIFLGGKR